jgi:acyl-CoA thioesterase I
LFGDRINLVETITERFVASSLPGNTMRHYFRPKLAAAFLALTGLLSTGPIPNPSTGATVSPPQCAVPVELSRLDGPLQRTASHLNSGDPIVIVALGSSSTAGAGASSATTTYPSQLAVELVRHFPSQPISVLNRGINGDLATDMLARFDKSVAAEHPDLVLWQLGTNAVLRGDERSLRNSLIQDGIRRMKGIGADVVLMDPQFAPKVIVKPDVQEVVDLIATAAKQERVGLFHRFALMRHWHDVEGMAFETFVSSDGLHMNDWSYNCLAKAVANAIARTAAPPGEVGQPVRERDRS